MDDGYILSYHNPDTDSLCSSVAYSIYMAKKGKHYKVVASGEISPEAQYVLKKAKIEGMLSRPRQAGEKDLFSIDIRRLMGKANVRDVIFDCDYDSSKDVVLIDTHHLAQLPHLKDVNRVVKIIDHHPGGDASVFVNALIDNREIGAAATIIAESILAEKLMDRQLAILLGGAIISNTMNFAAPSTTVWDETVFETLQKYYKITDKFVSEMFFSKNDVLSRSTEEILDSSSKLFEFAGKKVRIAQIELVDIEKNVDLAAFKKSCLALGANGDVDFFFLSFVDIVRKKTFVLTFDEASRKLRNSIFQSEAEGDLMTFDRILLRKTDFIAQIKKVLG